MESRKRVAETYRGYLKDIAEIELPLYQIENAETSWFVYVVQLRNASLRQRDDVLHYLDRNGVSCSNYFSPIHLQRYFREMGYSKGNFPITENVANSTVALPFFNDLKEQEVAYITQTLRAGIHEVITRKSHLFVTSST